MTINLADIIEEEPTNVSWHSSNETQKLLGMMSEQHLSKVRELQASGTKVIATIYKRTRFDKNNNRVQRAEIRTDGIAGCLRTPSGGSSRQTIMLIEKEAIRSRLLSPREAARLMGLPDTYVLPTKCNDAYHLMGDGVAVPVVRFLSAHLLEKLVALLYDNRGRAA